jgi:hypothetical protein
MGLDHAGFLLVWVEVDHRNDSPNSRSSMPKCQHCGNTITDAQIMYRDANTGHRRANMPRFNRVCLAAATLLGTVILVPLLILVGTALLVLMILPGARRGEQRS